MPVRETDEAGKVALFSSTAQGNFKSTDSETFPCCFCRWQALGNVGETVPEGTDPWNVQAVFSSTVLEGEVSNVPVCE